MRTVRIGTHDTNSPMIEGDESELNKKHSGTQVLSSKSKAKQSFEFEMVSE